MKKTISRIAIAAVSLVGAQMLGAHVTLAQLAVPAGTRTVTINDKVNKNQFIWLSEAPMENIKGSSEAVSGTFTFDPSDLRTLRGTITTQVKSMKTGNGTRDSHLLSAEWMDAAKYPTISFAIKGVSAVNAKGNSATALATGEFTMHGVTEKIQIPFKLTYLPESDKTRLRAPGDLVMISADFNIALKDFKVAGTEGLVGSKVGENIKINAQLFGNTGKESASN